MHLCDYAFLQIMINLRYADSHGICNTDERGKDKSYLPLRPLLSTLFSFCIDYLVEWILGFRYPINSANPAKWINSVFLPSSHPEPVEFLLVPATSHTSLYEDV